MGSRPSLLPQDTTTTTTTLTTSMMTARVCLRTALYPEAAVDPLSL